MIKYFPLLFRQKFRPRDYLDVYYYDVDIDLVKNYIKSGRLSKKLYNAAQENVALLIFYTKTILPLVKSKMRNKLSLSLLEVGGGPTVYQLISLSSIVSSIVFTDFLKENRKIITRILKDQCPYWFNFIKASLMLEKDSLNIDSQQIQTRAELIDKKVKEVVFCDVTKTNLSLPKHLLNQQFDIVSTNFCPESITNIKEDWFQILSNIVSSLKTGGRFIMVALKGSSGYKIINDEFPAVPIYESDIKIVFKDLKLGDIIIQSTDSQSYDHKGIILATAVKQ